ncbi:hypothetical protein ACCO45_010551 [Purpureocillium lilacinum]|uniref:Uncharacterized protein n=1 Tax=Purpureocillium lilacinum TaxID=33203 RepID=A0ACC4DFV4_PURLI
MPPPHPTWSWRSRQSFSGKRPDEPLESTGMSEPELPSSRSRSATGRNVEANGDGLDYAFKGWRGGNSLLCQRVGRLSSGQREELAWPLGRVRGSPWGSAPIELSDADAAAGEVGAECRSAPPHASNASHASLHPSATYPAYPGTPAFLSPANAAETWRVVDQNPGGRFPQPSRGSRAGPAPGAPRAERHSQLPRWTPVMVPPIRPNVPETTPPEVCPVVQDGLA